jgi:hypothetical protein
MAKWPLPCPLSTTFAAAGLGSGEDDLVEVDELALETPPPELREPLLVVAPHPASPTATVSTMRLTAGRRNMGSSSDFGSGATVLLPRPAGTGRPRYVRRVLGVRCPDCDQWSPRIDWQTAEGEQRERPNSVGEVAQLFVDKSRER